MKILKILRPALCLLVCVIAIALCLTAAKDFHSGDANTHRASYKSVQNHEYFLTDYEYYGGDAYTGIQQAGADASNNVAVLGAAVTEAANMMHDVQATTANNVAALAVPLNAGASSIAAIGSLLSTALALAFAIPGLKSLFDLIGVILELKKESAATAAQPEETIPENDAEAELSEPVNNV